MDLGNPKKDRLVKNKQDAELKINKTEEKEPEHVQNE